MITNYLELEPKEALRLMNETLHEMAEQQRQGRIYTANGTYIPRQVFQLAAIVDYLARLALVQQEQIVALQEQTSPRKGTIGGN